MRLTAGTGLRQIAKCPETQSWSTCSLDAVALRPVFGAACSCSANTDVILTIQHMKQEQLAKLEEIFH